MTEQNTIYSLVWFQREQWLKLEEVVDDPSTLDDTYEDWKKSAEQAIGDFRKNGLIVKKISIKVDDLLAWCAVKNVKPDSEARSEYATVLTQQRASKSHMS